MKVWVSLLNPSDVAISPCGSFGLLGNGTLSTMSFRYAWAVASNLLMSVVLFVHFPAALWATHTGALKTPCRCAAVGMLVMFC